MNFSYLYDYCNWKKVDKAVKLLKETEETGEIIDILYRDGVLLSIAFENNLPDLMKELLDYYERNNAPKAAESSAEEESTLRITKIIDEIVMDEEISVEMRAALGRYLDEDDRSHSGEGFEYDSDHDAGNKEVPLSDVFSREALGGAIHSDG